MKSPRSTSLIGGAISLALVMTACVDPAGKFDDFKNRIPDAAPTPDAEILLEIPDVSGRFYFALASVVDVDRPFLFIATNTVNPSQDGDPTIDTSLQPLDYVDKTPVGDPLVFNNITIAPTGQFVLSRDNVTLPGDANPISGSPITLSTITLTPTIKNIDLYCGPVEGMAVKPLTLDLTGSNMGAIRVGPDAIGDDLPDAVGECPPDGTTPDAGVPDAMPAPDATPPILDAGLPDADDDDNNGGDVPPSP